MQNEEINLNDILNTNFDIAMHMSEGKYSYEELLGFLKSGEIVEKQIAALELSEIKSKEDALILVSNLVGQDGKVREAVAFKINELFQNSEYMEYFIDEKIFNLFLEGIMDINGNVCRQIIGLGVNEKFKKYLCDKLPDKIREILSVIEKLEENEKQYKISKRNFQLYWCLEALYNIIDIIDIEKIKDILLVTGEFCDYTIREKTAKIIAEINNSELDGLREKLINDENYYVRRCLK